MIQSAGSHVNEDFIMSEMRFVDVGVVQNTGVAVFMDNNGFHDRPPQWGMHKCTVSRRIVARYVGGTCSGCPY